VDVTSGVWSELVVTGAGCGAGGAGCAVLCGTGDGDGDDAVMSMSTISRSVGRMRSGVRGVGAGLRIAGSASRISLYIQRRRAGIVCDRGRGRTLGPERQARFMPTWMAHEQSSVC
jgi:hypothetical protein